MTLLSSVAVRVAMRVAMHVAMRVAMCMAMHMAGMRVLHNSGSAGTGFTANGEPSVQSITGQALSTGHYKVIF